MLIKAKETLRYSDVTPEPLYLGRRQFIRTAAVLSAGVRSGLPPAGAPLRRAARRSQRSPIW